MESNGLGNDHPQVGRMQRATSVPTQGIRRSKQVMDCVLLPSLPINLKRKRSANDGIRSAPNSPTSKARVLRSSSRASLPPMSHSARVATTRLAQLQRPKKTPKAKTPAKPRKKAAEIQDTSSVPSPRKVVDLGRFAPNPPAGLMTPTPSLESLNGSSNPYGAASANDDILQTSPRPPKRRRIHSMSSRGDTPAISIEITDIKGQEESILHEDLEIDFQMLRLEEVVSLPWVPVSDSGKLIFVPPGVHQLIDNMRLALEQESKARRHAEDRHMEEINQRVSLEKRIQDLERAHSLNLDQ